MMLFPLRRVGWFAPVSLQGLCPCTPLGKPAVSPDPFLKLLGALHATDRLLPLCPLWLVLPRLDHHPHARAILCRGKRVLDLAERKVVRNVLSNIDLPKGDKLPDEQLVYVRMRSSARKSSGLCELAFFFSK